MKRIINNIVLTALMICALCIPATVVNAAQISSADSAVVAIEKYEIVEDGLIPGEEITLKLSLKNSSMTADAQNTVLTFEAANGYLKPVYGDDNQIQVGTIPAGSIVDVEMKAVVNRQYDADTAQMKCYFTYISKAVSLSNTVVIDIPTNVTGSLTAESVTVVEKATQNVNTLISMRCKNDGTAAIAGAKLIVDGNVAEENRTISMDTIGAGKTASDDYEICFVESGIQDLKLQIQYTDANGDMRIMECGEYKVNVVENVSEAINDTVVELADGGEYIVPVCILAVVFIMIVGLTVIYIRSRR